MAAALLARAYLSHGGAPRGLVIDGLTLASTAGRASLPGLASLHPRWNVRFAVWKLTPFSICTLTRRQVTSFTTSVMAGIWPTSIPFSRNFNGRRGQLVKRFLSNAVLVPKVIGDSVSLPVAFWSFAVWKLHQHYRTFPSVPDVVFSLLNAAWGLVVIAGMAILFLRGESLIAASVALTLAAIAAAPGRTRCPYMAPLAPSWFFCFFFSV